MIRHWRYGDEDLLLAAQNKNTNENDETGDFQQGVVHMSVLKA